MTRHQSLISVFQNQVAAAPAAIALVDGDHSWTYDQLDEWSDAVYALLRKGNIEPGSLVGISMKRGAQVVAAILGILKAGSGYVPLDPSYPTARLAFIAADAKLAAVLGDQQAPVFLSSDDKFIEMIPLTTGIRFPERAVVGSQSPAYVIYTSGSTGTPKGVLIRHANVLSLFRSTSRHFSFGPNDNWALFHSYSFDFSVWEIWGALLFGGRLTCVPDSCRTYPSAMAEFLALEHITIFNVVPSVFRHLMTESPCSTSNLSLRYVIFGGETIDPSSVSRWVSAYQSQFVPTIVNMYGITETTIHATYRQVTDEDFHRTGTGTLIGTALSHFHALLLDQEFEPVPAGEQGEIFIAGALPDGYLHREELTRERFPVIIDSTGKAARYFRTGDIAAWSAEHRSLVYHGRHDDQVKIRGFRIELGEIESALRESTEVLDGAVVVEETADGQQALAAYITPRATADVDLASIRRHLREHLPLHMIPKRICAVAALPCTASGKVDRKALRDGRS